MDILIVHDLREPAAKCSVTPLRGLPGVRFAPIFGGRRVDAGQKIWLDPEGEELTRADRGPGLLLIDCVWHRVPKLAKFVSGDLIRRRLPPLLTAYPRRSKLGRDPEHGLASVEALYAALAILGTPAPELLAHYRWAGEFLAANPGLVEDQPTHPRQSGEQGLQGAGAEHPRARRGDQHDPGTEHARAAEKDERGSDDRITARVQQREPGSGPERQKQVVEALVEGEQSPGLGIGQAVRSEAAMHLGLHEPQALHAEHEDVEERGE